MNCLNFGNPEHPEVMWQFSEVDRRHERGLPARSGIPVVGGNVSFYNESRGRDIDPTPVVGVVGVIDELDAVPPPPPRCTAGDAHRAARHDARGARRLGVGDAPRAPRRARRPRSTSTPRPRCTTSCARWSPSAWCDGVHDCSDGGLAVALAEMAIAGECGAQRRARHGCAPGARVVLGVGVARACCRSPPTASTTCSARAAGAGVPAAGIGIAGGDRLVAPATFDVALADAADAWRDAIPRALGHESGSDVTLHPVHGRPATVGY